MTISEQLHFSVLSAPVAMLDRRALSQAWYSALYGNGAAPSRPGLKGAHTGAQMACAPPRAAGAPGNLSGAGAVRTQTSASESPVPAECAPEERRAPRSPLARKIERAFLRPRGGAGKASFSVEGEHGRVHVILQSSGSQLKIVAICSQKARAHVAAALAQARYALALRGIDLDAQMRSAVSC